MQKATEFTIHKGLYVQGVTFDPKDCIEKENGVLYDVITFDLEQSKIVNHILKHTLNELIWKLEQGVINESKFIQEVKDMVKFGVAA